MSVDLFNILNEESKNAKNVCYSGGADGSDRFFGIWATKNDHELLHYGFKGHKYKGHDPQYNVIVPKELLESDEIIQLLNKANQVLNRKVPSFGYVYNLLARNRYQIKNTERVYCMVEEVYKKTVAGGTGWAVEMYRTSAIKPEIYAYSIGTGKVFEYDHKQEKFIEVLYVPTPYGRWTGIGTRAATMHDLNKFSKKFKDELCQTQQ